jgi:membrane protease YdiL (CAAX protease family)
VTTLGDTASAPTLVRFWQRLPAVVRAAVLGELVCDAGGLPPYLLMFGNLKLWPAIPLFVPLSAAWLWLLWQYLNGRGWPRSTSLARHAALRARPLPSDVWRWSLLAGGLGIVSVVGLAFVTARLANLPRDAFKISMDVSVYPPWTVISILLVISLSAGVVEEAAFRGYALSLIQQRHGWVVAVILTGAMFFVTHLGHAYVTVAFLPFFLAVTTVHGLLVYFTGSILPSVVLHATADFVVIPVQYGLIGSLSVAPIWKTGLDASFVLYVCIAVLFGLAAVPPFRRLAALGHELRLRNPDRAADPPRAANG